MSPSSLPARAFALILSAAAFLLVSGCNSVSQNVSQQPALASSTDTSLARQIQPSFFGMSVVGINDQSDGMYGWPTVPFSGCRLWGAHGTDVIAAKGRYSWQGLDRAVNFCVAQGKQVMFTFGNVPNWMNGAAAGCGNPYCESGKPPLHNDDWLNYVRAVAERYKGKIKYYELWNEPDTYPNGWAGTVPQLMALVKGEYTIIKQVDPDALTISPTTGSQDGDISYFNSLLENGAGTYADLIGFHGYTTKHYQAATDARSPEAILSDVEAMQASLEEYGLGGKKMVDAESSWNMCLDKKTGFCGDEDLQAAFVSVRYIVYAMRGLHSYWWYEWDGDTEGDTFWGSLYHRNGSDEGHPRVTKAGVAYGVVREWLVGAAPSDTGCTHPLPETWSCAITRPGGYEGVFIWSAGKPAKFVVPAGMVRMRDLDGDTTTVVPGAGIRLSNKPVLLENMAP